MAGQDNTSAANQWNMYLAQQARVSNWVSDTLQQSHAYSNPFVLSPTFRDRSLPDEPDDTPSSRSRNRTEPHFRFVSTLRDPIYPSYSRPPLGQFYPPPPAAPPTPRPRVSTSPEVIYHNEFERAEVVENPFRAPEGSSSTHMNTLTQVSLTYSAH